MHDLPAILGVLLAIGICVGNPVCGIVAWAMADARRARQRHEERLAMIEKGLVPPDDAAPPAQVRADVRVVASDRRNDPARGLGAAVGLLVAGILWLLPWRFDFIAIVLVGLGAAYLTRGIVGLLRERGDASGPSDKQGGAS